MLWNDLVVVSHLRWPWVWQRPHHLISRFAAGQRTWYVEEPIVGDVDEPTLGWNQHGDVTQVWLTVPGPERHVDFDDPAAAGYTDTLLDLIDWQPRRAVWLYTPTGLDIARALEPGYLVYDVMDDLASFKDAPPSLRQRQDELLAEADVVFTGGRSLQRSVESRRPDAHCFPSGVELEHFLPARDGRSATRERPVAGYVGVIDERVDLDLVAGLAAELPGWDVEVVGPVAKIDPADLPTAPNLRYPGPCRYKDLPEALAGFDVAIMPFALNEATRSISPTKTLEYFAAGLPVVSTRVPDVVADYEGVVRLADDPATFADECRAALAEDASELDRLTWPVLRRQHWDAIASRMAAVMRPVPAVDLAALEETV